MRSNAMVDIACLTIGRVATAVIVTITATSTAHSTEPKTAIIYAKTKEPFNTIYHNISQNVMDLSTRSGAYQKFIDNNEERNKLDRWINKKNIRNAVVLGKKAAKKIHTEHGDVSFVLGATFINPHRMPNISGVSMAPSPYELFQHLKHLTPHILTVHVIYNPKQQQWLMQRALQAAKNLQLTLIMHPAKDISETALLYKKIVSEQVASKEALWLPYSGKPIQKALRQEILQASWKRKLIVFSSNLSDVNKGILFSLFVNHDATGKQLFELMERRKSKPSAAASVQLAKNLNRAINTRTAAHLGIKISEADKAKYALLYPLVK